MAVISVRFNDRESRILKRLSSELDLDQSTLIKKSVMDAYEDLVDRQVIADFEKVDLKGKAKFHSLEQIIGI
jgi:hypothetical protein